MNQILVSENTRLLHFDNKVNQILVSVKIRLSQFDRKVNQVRVNQLKVEEQVTQLMLVILMLIMIVLRFTSNHQEKKMIKGDSLAEKHHVTRIKTSTRKRVVVMGNRMIG